MSSSCFECTCGCCPLDLLRQGGAKHAPFNRSHYLCTHPQTNPLLVQIQHVCRVSHVYLYTVNTTHTEDTTISMTLWLCICTYQHAIIHNPDQ